MARHPKRQELTDWLDGHNGHLDDHISTCSVCANELERITISSSNDDPEPSDLGPALLELLQPPDDLHERLSARLAERLKRRDDFNLLSSLLGVPVETGGLVILRPADADELAEDIDPHTPKSDPSQDPI